MTEQRGIPLPVLRSSRSLEQYLAAARIVENTVPVSLVEETAQLVEPPRSRRSLSDARGGARRA